MTKNQNIMEMAEVDNISNKPKLIVVRSNGDRGKTTTIWMVLYALKSSGAAINNFKDYSGSITLPASMPPVGSLPDFEADVTWNGKHIIIFSFGDEPTFVDSLMKAALAKHPDYIICASRSQYRTNSTWELFETTYTNILFERVCLWSEFSSNIADAIRVKQPTVEAIMKYMA